MSKPRLLDLFCGAGGCSVGYARAGFDVEGVDVVAQPNYPFRFWQKDALDVLCGWVISERFDAIHASPPCQDYSRALRHMASPQPRLIDKTRELLEEIGLPWVIENVPGAPLATGSDLLGAHGVELCGEMFGLRVQRHRLFETSFPVTAPAGCIHVRLAMNPHNQAGRDRIYEEFGRQDPEVIWRKEMGVEWMTKAEGRNAIPPAYTEAIGKALLSALPQDRKEAA